jgi:hypothetical protein
MQLFADEVVLFHGVAFKLSRLAKVIIAKEIKEQK